MIFKKYLSFGFLSLVIFFFITSVVLGKNNRGQITIEAKKIDYQLPYPGILPDNPLYFVKSVRDQIVIFFTRDSIKKAQMHLLLSDKKIVMAQQLSEKGKWGISIKTIKEAENLFLDILSLVKKSKAQGISPADDLLLKLKLSNQKHKEIVEEILKNSPQGQKKAAEEVLNLNREIEKKLISM